MSKKILILWLVVIHCSFACPFCATTLAKKIHGQLFNQYFFMTAAEVCLPFVVLALIGCGIHYQFFDNKKLSKDK